MMKPEEIRELLAAICDWLAQNGQPTTGILCGSLFVDVYRYEDPKVDMLRSRFSDEMEIVRKYAGSDNGNPVICCDAKGNCYRFHGEFWYIVDHLKALVGRK